MPPWNIKYLTFRAVQYGIVSLLMMYTVTFVLRYNTVQSHDRHVTVSIHSDLIAYNTTITTVSETSAEIAWVPQHMCPTQPPGLVGLVPVNLTEPENIHAIEAVQQSVPPVNSGGRWRPDNCTSWCRLAVVMPYRSRLRNLKLFMQHLHPFLQKQQIEYQMFVIEPQENDTFNRGILKNIGFVESLAGKFDCVVFHDIDLLPEHDHNLYRCGKMPHHLVISINTNQYRPLYHGAVFGGAVMFKIEHFQQVNGYSNLYFNWGAEDDDLLSRVRWNHLKIGRRKSVEGRYTEALHEKDHKRPHINKLLYRRRERRTKTDGLNSLNYTVLERVYYPAYTWVRVTFNESHYQEQVRKAMT